MNYLMACAICLLSLLGAGCAGEKSKELFETAQFEEKQHNVEHAQKLYSEIVAKYSGSPMAKKAQERLTALRAKP